MKLELLDLRGYAEFVDYRKEPGVVYLVRLDQPRKHFFYVGRTGQRDDVVEAVYRVVAGIKVGGDQDKQHWWELPAPKKEEPSCRRGPDSACGDSCNCRRVSDETNRFWNDLNGWQPGVE